MRPYHVGAPRLGHGYVTDGASFRGHISEEGMLQKSMTGLKKEKSTAWRRGISVGYMFVLVVVKSIKYLRYQRCVSQSVLKIDTPI
jgi:hypothetical protein